MIDYIARAGALGRLPDAVLIDAYVPGQPGGTGSLVADEVIDSIPPLPRLILAGGLDSRKRGGARGAGEAVDGRRCKRG